MYPEELLKEHGLRLTKVRKNIINILANSQLALSMAEIKEQFKGHCDRVTLYRNLKVLTSKGLLHQVVVDSRVSKFVLPESSLIKNMNYCEHVHFRCIRCKKVRCLTDQKIASVKLPAGFTKLESTYVIQGICDECNNSD